MPRTRAIGTSPRTLVRPPQAEDGPAFVAAMRASRTLHGSWVSPPLDLPAYEAFLQRAGREDQRSFLVVRRDDAAIAGVVNVQQIFYGPFCNAYLGYYGVAATAGAGHMTEGLAVVIRHAFTRLGLHRLEANIQPTNAPSIALVARLGFRNEGYSPRYLKIAGRWRDHERWAMTIEDWRAGVGVRAD